MNISGNFPGPFDRWLLRPPLIAAWGLATVLAGCATPPGQPAPIIAQATNNSPQLINQFRAILPASPALCNSSNPWQSGGFALANQGYLNRGECFGIELNLLKKSDVFLFNEDADGRWQYLPAGGTGYSYDHYSLNVGEWLQFPAHNVFDVASREERVHVFAIDSTAAVNAMNQILREQAVCCNPRHILLANPKEKLQAFSRQYNTVSEWRSVSVRSTYTPML